MQLASRVTLLIGALTAGGFAQEAGSGVRSLEETTDSGMRIERQVIDLDDGDVVNHGSFKSFLADGARVAEGEFEQGLEEGPWVFYHPSGAVRAQGSYGDGRRVGDWVFLHADGAVYVKGVYKRGLRRGRWTYRDADGRKTKETGTYKPEIENWDNGLPRVEGERRLKYRHGVRRWYRETGPLACEGYYSNGKEDGAWIWYRPDGTPLLSGVFKDGLRTGEWLFHHSNGRPDPGFLSAVFEAGETGPDIGDAPPPPDVAGEIDLREFADPRLFAGLTGPDQNRLEELVRLVRGGTDDERAAIRAELLDWEITVLPKALHYLKRLDLEREDDTREASHLYNEVVVRASNGHAFPWIDGQHPGAVQNNYLSILRWLTLWDLTADSPTLWADVRATRPAHDPSFIEDQLRDRLYGGLLDDPLTLPSEVLREEAWPAFPWVRASREELREQHGGESTEAALDRALVWLAAHQAGDGRWDCDGFLGVTAEAPGEVPEAESSGVMVTTGAVPGFGQPYHDVAVTALALMAFTSAGNSLQQGSHLEVVQGAVTWLQSVQDESGLFEVPERNTAFFYCHVMATWAMADVVRDSRNPMLRRQVQAAVDAIVKAQNPGAGWRYGTEPSGENDSSITAWAVSALQMARRSGLHVDDAVFKGALAWFDSMTDKSTGRAGYYEQGSPSIRFPENLDYPYDAGETLTAAALWSRLLCGQRLETHPALERQAKLVLTRSPEWRPGALGHDMIHWYFGSLSMFQFGGAYWESWNTAAKKTLLASQNATGPYSGSWDPVGPWGYLAGRVYSTALCAATLAVYHRYERYSD